MTSTNNNFGKEKHLKSRKQIDQLFTGGKAFFVHPIKVFWRMELPTTDDGLPTTGETQTADDERRTSEEMQLTDDRERAGLDRPLKSGEVTNTADTDLSPVISHRSSLVGRPSSLVDRPSSAISVGVSASKRNFKKAVDRNRVKRLLREVYRLNQQALESAMAGKNTTLQVFFIFVDKTIPTFALVQEKMLICLKRLQKIAGEAKNEKLL